MALAVGLVPFTIQYICLRAFYALEDNRTTFFLQCLIAGANVGLGVATVLLLDRPSLVATGLAASYSAAYLIGVVVSFRRLRRRLPDLNARRAWSGTVYACCWRSRRARPWPGCSPGCSPPGRPPSPCSALVLVLAGVVRSGCS